MLTTETTQLIYVMNPAAHRIFDRSQSTYYKLFAELKSNLEK